MNANQSLNAEACREYIRTIRNAAKRRYREPQAGKRSYRNHPTGLTYEEAQRYCRNWNTEHNPGPLSRKAEFEEA